MYFRRTLCRFEHHLPPRKKSYWLDTLQNAYCPNYLTYCWDGQFVIQRFVTFCQLMCLNLIERGKWAERTKWANEETLCLAHICIYLFFFKNKNTIRKPVITQQRLAIGKSLSRRKSSDKCCYSGKGCDKGGEELMKNIEAYIGDIAWETTASPLSLQGIFRTLSDFGNRVYGKRKWGASRRQGPDRERWSKSLGFKGWIKGSFQSAPPRVLLIAYPDNY